MKNKPNNMHIKARQFVMERIKNWETIENRKFYLEPKIIDELVYYIYETWRMSEGQKSMDLNYLDWKVNPEEKYIMYNYEDKRSKQEKELIEKVFKIDNKEK